MVTTVAVFSVRCVLRQHNQLLNMAAMVTGCVLNDICTEAEEIIVKHKIQHSRTRWQHIKMILMLYFPSNQRGNGVAYEYYGRPSHDRLLCVFLASYTPRKKKI
jgi:hypothetical protein